MSIEKILKEATLRAMKDAWEIGFRAGQSYGQACEQFDPNRDPGWDEPEKPRNPYLLPGSDYD